MKIKHSLSGKRRAGVSNGLLMAIIAALAVGIGVTGTLLWTQNHAATATTSATSTLSPAASAPASPIAGLNVPNLPNLPAPPGAAPGAAPGAPAPDAPPSIAGLTSSQAALTMGNYHYDQQHWPQAIASYRAAIGGGFDNPNVHTDLGNALRFAGQPQQALEQYKIAQKQDPTHQQSLFNQGGLWAFALHNNAKAVAAWRAYLKRFPHGQSADQAREFIKQHQ